MKFGLTVISCLFFGFTVAASIKGDFNTRIRNIAKTVSGVSSLKQLSDVDYSGLTQDANGNYILGSGGGAGMSIGGAITSATAGSVLFAGASGVLAQDNSNFFWDDTNNRLGIGTTSPAYKLDVQGDIGLGATSATTAHLYMNSTTRNQIIAANGSSLEFWDGATENARFDANGNFGIGTTSPGAKLDVAGDTIIKGGGLTTLSLGNATANWGTQLKLLGYANSHKNWQIDVGMTGSNFNITPSTADGGTTFTTAALSIDSLGNVGIGTTSPIYQLDVGTGHILGVTSNSIIFKNNNAFTYSGSIIQIGQDVGWTQMALYSSNAERIRIDASGNVGIGTTTPQYKFQVAGASGSMVEFRETTSANGTALAFAVTSGVSKIISSWETTGGSASDLAFITTQSGGTQQEAMRILGSNGNVGIGTTTPGAMLQVNASSAATIGQIIKGFASQTGDLTQWQNSSGTVLAKIESSGNITTTGYLTVGLGALINSGTDGVSVSYHTSGGFDFGSAGSIGWWSSGIGAGSRDIGLLRSSAGVLKVTNGSSGFGDLSTGRLVADNVVRLKGYTVATLPAGTIGDTAYCTDLLSPTFMGVATGGGAVVGKVFFNGTNWITQ